MAGTTGIHHAARRLQQRGIPEDVLPLLVQFGAHEYDKRGAKLVYLTHKSRERVRRRVGAVHYSRLGPTARIASVAIEEMSHAGSSHW